MKYFYGVYLESTSISTILDVIRFLGEPDSIRFAHITLRGPYASPLDKIKLHQMNASYPERAIKLCGPGTFFSDYQSTVVISVDLQSLQGLLYKPDFPNGVPHITLYDGRDREFAKDLYDLASRYVWENIQSVGPLREITAKKQIDQEFLPFFTSFYNYFSKLVGHPDSITEMRRTSPSFRLQLIESILERCTTSDVATPNASTDARPSRTLIGAF